MYQSLAGIEKKLAQAHYTFSQLQKYEGKIIVNNGLDPETGAYPLLVHLSSFLSNGRSVLQYAYKEAEARGLVTTYERFVASRRILGLFKELRNSDVHEYTVGAHTFVRFEVKVMHSDEGNGRLRQVREGEKLESAGTARPLEAKGPQIETRLAKRVIATEKMLEEWQRGGRGGLVKAAREGKELYEEVEFEGEKDLFKLCEDCLRVLEEFVEFGKKKGFIS